MIHIPHAFLPGRGAISIERIDEHFLVGHAEAGATAIMNDEQLAALIIRQLPAVAAAIIRSELHGHND